MDPKVSVIIPVYKTEQYLRECLDSVLEQSLREIEVICINDGSPDHSLDILQEYEEKDSRIIIINKENAGVGAARNDGILKARGEFLSFVDSDDFYYSSSALKSLYTAATENSVKACLGYLCFLTEDGTLKEMINGTDSRASHIIGEFKYKEYQYDYGYSGGIYERKMIMENNIRFPLYGRFQDPPFFVKTMITADNCFAIDEPVYCYRQVQDSGKISFQKTMDMLLGIKDNLLISKENNLGKLHYLTACRLNEDASYMTIQNLFNPQNKLLMARLIQTTACVDTEWLKKEGFDISEPFLPEAFCYQLELAEKYERIRTSKILRALTCLPRKLKRG